MKSNRTKRTPIVYVGGRSIHVKKRCQQYKIIRDYKYRLIPMAAVGDGWELLKSGDTAELWNSLSLVLIWIDRKV